MNFGSKEFQRDLNITISIKIFCNHRSSRVFNSTFSNMLKPTWKPAQVAKPRENSMIVMGRNLWWEKPDSQSLQGNRSNPERRKGNLLEAMMSNLVNPWLVWLNFRHSSLQFWNLFNGLTECTLESTQCDHFRPEQKW